MWTISEKPMWLMCACGDAIKVDYIKKIYVWYIGYPPNRKFEVRADIDGGAKADSSVIVDIFDDIDAAKIFIQNLVGANLANS